jgi:hypothetical protein
MFRDQNHEKARLKKQGASKCPRRHRRVNQDQDQRWNWHFKMC